MKKEKQNRDRTCCTQKSLMDTFVHAWVQDVQLFRGVPSFNTSIRAPNGLRYPLVGGTRQRHFAGTNFKPRKLPKNAQTPTTTRALAPGASVAPAFARRS